MKKVGILFVLLCGIAGLYAAYRGFYILHKPLIEVVGILGFSLALISVAIPKLVYQQESLFFLGTNRWTVYSYVLGSLGFAVSCFAFAWQDFGWNTTTIIGILGVLFFGLGSVIILYTDFKAMIKRYLTLLNPPKMIFYGNFLGRDIVDPQTDVMPFLIHYQQEDWQECSGGYIRINDKSSLLIQKKIGENLFSLTYTIIIDNRTQEAYLSLGDSDLLNEFIDVGDEEFASLGTFISQEKAIVVVQDFLAHPLEKSPKIAWIESSYIDWNNISMKYR